LIGIATLVIAISALVPATGAELSERSLTLIAKPQPQATAFLITEISLLARLANSRETTEILFHDGRRSFGDDFGVIGCVTADLGFMINLSGRSAFGFSGFVAAEEFRHRAGARLRYRLWDIGAGCIEITGGPAFDITEHPFTKELNRRQWIVGSLSFSQTRFVHILFRAETHLQDYPPNRRVTAAYVGLKFGY
jgi:hypothetical protein